MTGQQLGQLNFPSEQLPLIELLQRQRRHMERAYVCLRRHHAPLVLRRAVCRQLNAADKLQAEWMEVAL